MSAAPDRLLIIALYLRDAALISWGGWLVVVLFLRSAPPMREWPRGVGFVLGFMFCGGIVVSALIYWVVTGVNGIDRLLGLGPIR